MRMKRTILKLLLTTCFLAALWQKDVYAAPTLDINSGGDIYIGKEDDGKDFVGRGLNKADAVGNKLPNLTANHKAGYNLSGLVDDVTTITVDIGKDNELNLTFNSLNMREGCHFNIISGKVIVTLKGTSSLRASASSPQSVININDTNAELHFTNSGQVQIAGADNQPVVSGGKLYIENRATVNLTKFGTGTPFNGKSVKVSGQAILSCFDGNEVNTYTDFSSNPNSKLFQDKGTVNATGLHQISYINQSLTKGPLNNGDSVDIVYTVNGKEITTKKDVESSGFIPLDEEMLDQTISIGRQELKIPGRTQKGSGATKEQDETTALSNDGIISNIDMNLMEYVLVPEEFKSMAELGKYIKDNADVDWTSFTSTRKTDCAPGYYYIRLKANNEEFATNPIGHPVYIKEGKILDYTPSDFKEVYGYTVPAPCTLTIRNYGDKDITINQVTLLGKNKDNFAITDNGGDTISCRTSKDDPAGSYTGIKVTPKVGLEAGSYSVTVEIGYARDGKNSLHEETIVFEVEKAEQPQPTDALAITNITHDSATLNGIPKNSQNKDADSGVEYCFNDENGEWNNATKSNEPKFSKKLSPGKKYYFLARYKETKNYKVSEPVMVEGETEKVTKIDYDKQTLKFPHDDREYTISVGKDGKPQTFKDTLEAEIPDEWCGKTITVTDKTTDGTQSLTIPAIRKAPTPKAVDEVIIGANGEITNVDTSMEFRRKTGKNTWSQWQDCPGKKIEEAEPGDYQVRRKYVPEKEFASASASITVHKGPSISVELQGADFEEIPYGTPRSGKIIIQNRDTVSIKLEGISLSAENFVITEGDKSIEPSDAVEWGIQPKEKLKVGTYESEIIVSYDDSQDDGSDDDNTGDDNTGGDTNPDNNTPGGSDTTPDNNTTGGGDSTETGGGTDNTETKQLKAKAGEDAEEVPDDEQSNIRTASIDVKATIIKADQPDVPPVPAEKSKTSTSITLETLPNNPATGAKVQYSKDGGKTWQDSPTFTGLSPNRDYTFVTRYGETENYNASEPCAGETTITTAEKDDKNSDGVNSQGTDKDKNSNDSNSSGNGTNGNGTNGSGTGTNGSGTGSGSDGSSGSKGLLSSAKTGDLNNIQLWVALMIGSYLSCAIIVKSRLKKAKS